MHPQRIKIIKDNYKFKLYKMPSMFKDRKENNNNKRFDI